MNKWKYLLGWLAAAMLVAGCGSETDRMVGAWNGTLEVSSSLPGGIALGKAQLPLVFHVEKKSDGALGGTFDSPAQAATRIPLDSITVKDGAVHMQANKIFGTYDGQMSKDGQEITGQWKQGPVSLPLTLKKSP